MDAQLASIIYEMRDRQEIYDCIMRYCRGIDRFDMEVALSAYHPDAIDDHGSTFIGPADKFLEAAFALHGKYQRRTQHMITNHIVTIDGDVAHAESYYLCRLLNVQAPWVGLATGRYLDRLEKRDGRWAIAARVCLVDIRDETMDPEGIGGDGDYMTTSRDRNDPSYRRPSPIDPERMGKTVTA